MPAVSSDTLEALFSHGEATLFVWRYADGWPIDYVSPNVERLLGFDAKQLVGTVRFADLVHPDDLERLACQVQVSLASGGSACTHDDYRLRHRDGGWRWMHDVSVVQRAADGRVERFVGYLVDVTQHHERSAALAEQRDRLRLVLESTRIGFWDWYPQSRELYFDEQWARMIGYERDELDAAQETWTSRMHPDDVGPCFEAVQAHMDGHTDYYENVHRVRHRDGRWLYVLDRGRVVVRDDAGRPVRFAGTHVDITAQKLAEMEAQRASRAKGDFLARMSHEIRTPLNGVLGVLQLLETTTLDERQQSLVETMRESGETLLKVINDVLDMSKIEAGQMRVEYRTFALGRALRSVYELYRERALSQRLGYEILLDDSVPQMVRSDEHRIRQVVANLLSNALKFTQRGRVVLAVRARSGEPGFADLEIEVRDTGPGIAEPHRLWDAFRQADESISRRFGGTGLGLSISRQLVELMGGVIELETAVGAGSTFRVRLPVEVVEAEAAPEAMARPVPTATRPLHVLVAEDNPVNQMVIRAMLRRMGHAVAVVEHGAAAVAACEAAEFDLVLMDLHMPIMDGFEASSLIRSMRGAEALPQVVAVSADVFVASELGDRGGAFDGALSKPFRMHELADVLATVPQRT